MTSGAGPDAATAEPLSAEDAKLVTLASGARGRAGAAEGAAVRDTDGRSYAAATVALRSLRLTALQAAVAAATASGAGELEAAVIVTQDLAVDPAASDVALARELSAAVLILATPAGEDHRRIVP